MMDDGTTDECRRKIANGSDDRSPKLTTCEARAAGSGVIHARPYASGIAEYLANRYEKGERACKFDADNPVQSDSKTDPAECREQRFPSLRVIFQTTRDTV